MYTSVKHTYINQTRNIATKDRPMDKTTLSLLARQYHKLNYLNICDGSIKELSLVDDSIISQWMIL